MSAPGTLEQNDEAMQQERRAKWTWTSVIVGFIMIQFIMSGVAIYLATSDPSHAVIPNYHQQALEYDKVLAEKKASHDLGWTWTIQCDSRQLAGQRDISVQLKDGQGHPLADAQVSLQLFHHARGKDRQKVTLSPAGQQPGEYRGYALVDRSGIWQVELSVQHHADHFTDRTEKYWSFAK